MVRILTKSLIVKICLADSASKNAPDEVYTAIESNPKIEECYRLDGTKVTAAAIDFVAIIASIGAISEIVNLFYQIWKDHKDKGKLYVGINPNRGIQLLISKDTTENDLQEFQQKIIAELKNTELNSIDKQLLLEIKETRYWIKTK